jgi:hypothetical protein
MKLNKMQGLSGQIEIDEKTGYRKNNILSIVDKSRSGVDLVSKFVICDLIHNYK